jgi:hypothetical protein
MNVLRPHDHLIEMHKIEYTSLKNEYLFNIRNLFELPLRLIDSSVYVKINKTSNRNIKTSTFKNFDKSYHNDIVGK